MLQQETNGLCDPHSRAILRLCLWLDRVDGEPKSSILRLASAALDDWIKALALGLSVRTAHYGI